jgi:DUF4097 and DUF4098 domain-containing protein YvlB
MKTDKFLLLALGALLIIILILLAMGGAAFLCLALTHNSIVVDNSKAMTRDQVYNGSLAGIDHVELTVHDVNGNVQMRESNDDSYSIEIHEKGTELSFQRYYVDFSQSGTSGSKSLDVHVRDNLTDQPSTNSRYTAEIIVTVPKNKTYSVDLANVNGDIVAGSFSGDKAVMTCVNGGITSDFSADSATFTNVNGGISAATSKSSGRITATDVNGDIEIAVPASAGFSMNAHLVNGEIRTTMALDTTEKSRFNVVGSTPGYSGNGLNLDLATVNGGIVVKNT